MIIKEVLDGGLEKMPLLGPRAGGTFFRLGPIFNYFQYLSVLIFGFSPQSLALPELILSTLSIPLFYLLLREFFKKNISVVLTFLYSISLFSLEYARFAWNPNSIPFFSILLFYSLLQFLKAKKPKPKIIFLILSALSFGVLIQLHTLCLAALPIILLIVFIYFRKKINWKLILIFVASVLIINLPLVINEFNTKFSNTRYFFDGITKKNKASEEFGIDRKIITGLHSVSRFYSMIITSSPIVKELDEKQRSGNIIYFIGRNLKPLSDFWNSLKSVLIFSLVGFLFYRLFKDFRKAKNSKKQAKKNFIWLLITWQLVYLLFFGWFSLKLDGRYYLTVIFIPFILLGYLINLFLKTDFNNKFKFLKDLKLRKIILGVLILSLILVNLKAVFSWFNLIKSYQAEAQVRERLSQKEEFILEDYYNVTLIQIEQAVDFIDKNSLKGEEIKRDQNQILGNPYYLRPVKYLAKTDLNQVENFYNYKNRPVQYFYVDDSKNLAKEIKKIKAKFDGKMQIKKHANFGTLTIYLLEVKSGQELDYDQEVNDESKEKVPERLELEDL
jgi:4-amino-4-deoxy-L-arabinose transferase-like glycosyltransferase